MCFAITYPARTYTAAACGTPRLLCESCSKGLVRVSCASLFLSIFQIQYHKDFEAQKGHYTPVADDAETKRAQESNKIASQIAYTQHSSGQSRLGIQQRSQEGMFFFELWVDVSKFKNGKYVGWKSGWFGITGLWMLLSSRKDINVCLTNLRSSEISEIKGCFEPLVYMVIRKFSSLAYRQDDIDSIWLLKVHFVLILLCNSVDLNVIQKLQFH